MNLDDIFRGNGIEIFLSKPDDFLKIRETLQRIGVASKKDNTLWQSAHILHKQGRYAILHFKELFVLDGKESDLTENDIERRNTIVKLLLDWKLATIKDLEQIRYQAPLAQIKVIPFKEKDNWNLVAKYSIGTKKRNFDNGEEF